MSSSSELCIIDRCSDDYFVFKGKVCRGSSVIFRGCVVALPGDLQSADDAESVLAHVHGSPETIFIVGVDSGEFERFLSRVLIARLQSLGLKYEKMSVAAACGTYNVLLHDGRDVCAILLFP
ncbi:MAG: Mth938-like domain-containing protein [Anaplasma sp.]